MRLPAPARRWLVKSHQGYRRRMIERICQRCRLRRVNGRVRLVPMNADKPERDEELCDRCLALLSDEITAGRTQWRSMVDLPLER
jgi:hypothetical protein